MTETNKNTASVVGAGGVKGFMSVVANDKNFTLVPLESKAGSRFEDLDVRDAALALGGEVTLDDSILCPGPRHKPDDRSLSVTPSDTNAYGFVCNSFAGDDWQECRAHVIDTLGLSDAPRPPLSAEELAEREAKREQKAEAEAEERAAKLAFWSAQWDRAPQGGGLSARYLKGRGLALPPGVFREPAGEMMARIVDPVSGELRGFHRTFIGGNPVVKRPIDDKGRCRQTEVSSKGVIRLIEGNRTLMVGEGIETALSLPLVLGDAGAAVWATGNCGNLERLPPLADFDELVIGVDVEPSGAGLKAAHACAARWVAAGKRVKLVVPFLPKDKNKFDMNDLLRVGGGPIWGVHYRIDEFGPPNSDNGGDSDDDTSPQSGRIRHLAPARDDERGPVMELLDAALLTDEAEPPMRDLGGHPVEVVLREPMGLHALTANAANDDEADASRVPPPPIHMIVRHDVHSLGLLVEKYVEFYKVEKSKVGASSEKPVALNEAFIKAYLAYRTSRLPKVGALMTMPVVLPDGTLLAESGLDRERKTLFRIEPGIRDLLPRGDVRDDDIRAAMRFLLEEWLCDVEAEGEGKCTLVALALSTLERLLLPERPAFFVTAGKRGGGKTTALNMISAAVTGNRAAATAWAENEDERRKALLPLLRQNCPMIVWDNIKLGTSISCPSLEKALTGEVYEDRVLGKSETERVPATTILCFTGNNIGPKGDMASRSLVVRIKVDRPDPENREFKHVDPVGWTLAHRGQILAALYTILLGNPRKGEQPRGRFKGWQQLVGDAVEHAAGLHGAKVEFGTMFLDVEAEDEEGLTNVEVLKALVVVAGGADKRFTSANVVKYLEAENGKLGSTRDEEKTLKAFVNKGNMAIREIPSAKTVTAKLRTIVDGPVQVGTEIWTLRSEATQKDTKLYFVETKAS